jgi:uncharacterized protein
MLGSVSLGLGLLGVILPGLPTTPFLLLTLFAYGKGSTRFYNWMIQTKLYKNHVQSFHESRSMSRKQKLILMIVTDLVVAMSFIIVPIILFRVMLIILVIIKYWYFHRYVSILENPLEAKSSHYENQIQSSYTSKVKCSL